MESSYRLARLQDQASASQLINASRRYQAALEEYLLAVISGEITCNWSAS